METLALFDGAETERNVFPATVQKLTQSQAGNTEARLAQVPAPGEEREDGNEDRRETDK